MRSGDEGRRDAGGDITACASSSVDSPPASTKRRHEEEAEAPRKNAKPNDPVGAASTPDDSPAKSHPQPPSPRATVSGGPAAAELHGATAHQPDAESSPIEQWGILISQFPQHPDISLKQKRMLLGRNPAADVNFKDDRIAFDVCSIKISQHGRLSKSSLHCLSAMRQLSFNGRKLQKNERVTLQGGDELLLSGQEPYSFVFQPSECNEASAAAAEAAPSSNRVKQPRPAAPDRPQPVAAERNAAPSTLPTFVSFMTATNMCRLANRPEACSPEHPQPREDRGEGEDNDHENRAAPALTLDPGSDIEAVEQMESASGLAVELANVCMQKGPLEDLRRSTDALAWPASSTAQPAASASHPASWEAAGSDGKARKQLQPPRRMPMGGVTISPSTADANAAPGRSVQTISPATGRHHKEAAAAAKRGGERVTQLAVSQAAAAVQEAASVMRHATERCPPAPPSMPPTQRQAWAEWMQEQAATAQAAAAQATAVAASAAAAVAESVPPQTPASSGPSKTLQKLVSDLESAVERHPGGDDPSVSWTDFPEYVSEGTRASLHNTAFLHLQRPAFTRLVTGVAGLCNRVWLSGPSGSELYQEQLVRALAKEQGAQLLVFDLAALLPPSQLAERTRVKGAALAAAMGAVSAGPGLMPEDDDDTSTCDEEEGIDDWAAELKGSGGAGWATPHFAAVTRRAANPSRGGATAGTFRRMAHSRAAMAHLSHQSPVDSARSTLRHLERSMAAQPLTVDHAAGGTSIGGPFRRGDRVRTIGASAVAAAGGSTCGHPGAGGYSTAAGRPILSSSRQGSALECAVAAAGGDTGARGVRGPVQGAVGTVLLTFPDNPDRVGVGFDVAVVGGISLNGVCPPGHGFFCSARQLAVERRTESASADRHAVSAASNVLFDFVNDLSRSAPLLVFLKDASKVSSTQVAPRLYACLAARMQSLEATRVVVIASHCEPPEVRKGCTGGGGLAAMLGGPTAMLGGFDHLLEGLPGRMESRVPASSATSTRVTKHLCHVMPNHVTLVAPPTEPALSRWNRMLDSDSATLRRTANAATLTKACAKLGLECKGIHEVTPSEGTLSRAHAERVVGWALSSLLTDASVLLPPQAAGPRLDLPQSCLKTALATHASIVAEGEVAGKRFKDLKLDNEFEKKLLEEVIPPDEVGATFDDIGALDAVKASLREVVMLPLQRPELFKRGALTKPTKGVLLFGPPGTGKTMLAKAVAAESGANFLNISMSALASKWFGEGEKYVKALFSLAHRLAPAVIFVDEVDSMLSRREKSGEHEAMRKIKNEFMSNWDGLRTNNADRVLVLAATNRPADLDEAVIRRLPRRLLVDLPDAPNRARILKVILKDEQLEEGFSLEKLAGMTTGYSGSDLKALCIAAAHRPIRDLLAREAAAVAEAEAASAEIVAPAGAPKAATEADNPEATAGNQATEAAAAKVSTTVGSGSSAAVVTAADDAAKGSAEATGAAVSAEALPCTAISEELRPLTMTDMKEAMKQVGASNSSDGVSMNELRQWNEMYGEGGSRRSEQPTYFM